MSLSDVQPGQSAIIVTLPIDGGLQQRFSALGLRCGQEIHMLRWGIMKSPLHLQIGMTEVMLRRDDAHGIIVKVE